GESVHSASSKYPDPESLKTFVKDPDGYLTISEEGIKRYFAADLSPEEQAVVAATQGPFHTRTLTAPVSQAAWREKPTFMVVATKDAIIPPQMESDQVKAAKATAIEVPSSHVAMLSFPKEVAELIIKAAEGCNAVFDNTNHSATWTNSWSRDRLGRLGPLRLSVTGVPPTATTKASIRTGLPGGSPQSHVFNMILESTRRRRAACSGFPPPRDEA